MHDSLSEWWHSISLRTKITGVTVLVLAFGILVAGIGTMAMLRPALQGQVDERLKAAAESMATYGKIDQSSTSSGGLSTTGNDFYFAFYWPDDGNLVQTNWSEKAPAVVPNVPTNIRLQDALSRGRAPFALDSANGSTHFRAVLIPVWYKDGPEQQGVMLVATSTREAENIIATYLTIFFGLGLAVILFGAALTRLLVTSTFTPLREVEHTAAAIADGDFSQRLAVTTPNTEVGRLSRSLNTMLDRIDQAFSDRAKTIGQMRRFVGDASHELRTPLVTVRGYAELYRMGALQSPEDVSQAMERIEKEAIRMGALVEDLLELARLDETKPLNLGRLDLSALARDAVMDARAADPGRAVTLVVDHYVPETPAPESLALPAGAPPRPPLPVTSGAEATPPLTRPTLEDDAVQQLDPTRVIRLPETDAAVPPAPEAPTTGRVRTGTGPLSRVRGEGTGPFTTRPRAEGTGPFTSPTSLVSRLRARRPRRGTPSAPIELVETHSAAPSAVPTLEIPAIVLAEENKIRQVITNLMGNAMRFTDTESPIEIGVSANSETRRASIAIIDHGEGIPEQIREKIFQRFWRADTSRTRETGGSGLGLAIVASIIGAHHGTVTVSETPGGGATFRVELPLLTEAPDAPPQNSVPSL
ncbi:sensor histidine kinase [Mycetocola tolaasinivorans]|uniref:histidine kinase n=1 Tax=Mycetocola tolaasinivorans TaxID=76635 RepID=A0A3L7AAW7_9MICO|nr:HAMP domain-containing sensor histidine kinase [Mycetocola tolaasinivorans]RLP77453.1 sensor histidine kinase [Mycetocola tolaasinivorans]